MSAARFKTTLTCSELALCLGMGESTVRQHARAEPTEAMAAEGLTSLLPVNPIHSQPNGRYRFPTAKVAALLGLSLAELNALLDAEEAA